MRAIQMPPSSFSSKLLLHSVCAAPNQRKEATDAENLGREFEQKMHSIGHRTLGRRRDAGSTRKCRLRVRGACRSVISFLATDEPAISISSNAVSISAKGKRRTHL